ncbi:MAG: hypothetical protein KJ957_06140 [Candidatus Omnitrophica bacterium]|nr:hypothetical protein [Candidatus Omnitrophota bacterium]
MDYIALSSTLRRKKMSIFTFEDIRNLFPEENTKTIKNNFTRWLLKGYFVRLKKGLYELVDPSAEFKIPDLYVANKLYSPSYISLETALSIFSIIPDIAAGVTSVTTRPTRTFKNKYGAFFYRTCKKKCFTGYRLMLYDGCRVYIADKEKALVDFLYYRLRSGVTPDFYEERFNAKILKKIDWKKTFRYAEFFNKKTVITLKRCKEYTDKC